ncbi:MAG: hypothetical protein VX730_07910 [Pseudomonadota bacterium]|nr:hypothetical protein [Pseudomonadota bacterium]
MYLAWLLLLPLLTPLIAKALKYDLNWQEILMQLVLVTALVFGGYKLTEKGMMADTEIWNGSIADKKRVRVSCEHSYQCNCVTDKDGKQTCQTCYEHSHDYDWRVYTNVGDFNIRRINRQGTKEPPRFTEVVIGEPAATEHTYDNYVQAANGSLYKTQMLDYEHLADVPEYPRVFDYYRAHRVLTSGFSLKDADHWQDLLNQELIHLGPSKQANVNLIITTEKSREYVFKVEAAWDGLNKNDVVVILSVDATDTINWAHVLTWAGGYGNEEMAVYLRDELQNIGTISDPHAIVHAISEEVDAHFVRPQMKQFAYLKSQINPPTWALVMLFLVGMGASLGLTRYFHRNDVRFL